MITCPICLQQFKKIDSQHLMKRHSLTKEQYLEKYPDGPLGASSDTKAKLGLAVKSRGPRKQETRDKISNTLKNNPQIRTEAQQAASAKNALKAGESNIGRKRDVSDQTKRNLSEALKHYYSENKKPSYKDNSERYSRQLTHISDLASRRKNETWDRLNEEVPELLSSWSRDCNIFIEDQRIKIGVTCMTCNGNIVRQIGTFKKHEWGSSICHTCYPPLKGTSKEEENINAFLISNGFNFERHCKGVLPNGLELDFYDKDRKIAIEYNGLYWHSSAMDYPKNKHRLKYELCRNKGIHLIQIFEDEWLQKQDIAKSRLLALLGAEKTVAYARKCSVEIIPFKEAAKFLDEHHLQGGGVRTKFNFGLKQEGEIVSVMTFQQKRVSMNQSKEDGAVELVRFAAAGRVPGAFSKLLKRAVDDMGVNKVYSWADLRWTNPRRNVYLSNGFTVHSESTIGYAYTDLVTRYHRYGRRKPAGEVLSEEQWNKELGFYQIFDAGTINYVYDIKHEE